MTDEKTRKTVKILLLVLIALSVLSCFIQSMMPPEISTEESNAVADVIAEVLPPDTPPGEFVAKNVRKIGHFFEYGIIGVELAVYGVLFIKGKMRAALISLAFVHCSAFIDESIQIFSGRGPSIADVWLDTLGFAVFYSVTLAIICLALLIKSKLKQRK